MYSSAPQSLGMKDLHADKRGDLPRREVTTDDVTVRYSRSGGPGGQNANKLVSRRHAAKQFESACTATRPRASETSLVLCGHAEY
jgi:protein subunit release factor B